MACPPILKGWIDRHSPGAFCLHHGSEKGGPIGARPDGTETSLPPSSTLRLAMVAGHVCVMWQPVRRILKGWRFGPVLARRRRAIPYLALMAPTIPDAQARSKRSGSRISWTSLARLGRLERIRNHLAHRACLPSHADNRKWIMIKHHAYASAVRSRLSAGRGHRAGSPPKIGMLDCIVEAGRRPHRDAPRERSTQFPPRRRGASAGGLFRRHSTAMGWTSA